MITEELQDFTKKSIELLTKCAVESFNNSYNLDLDVQQVLKNIEKKQEKDENKKKDLTERSEENENTEEITLLMENLCFAKKKDGTKCNKKLKGNNLLCSTHISSLEASMSLPDFVNIVIKEKKYEIKPKVLSIGNSWIEDTNMDKWPQIISTTTNPLQGYIMFFTEYDNYLGAGIFIIQYHPSLKKFAYNLATHYVEVNNYCENFGGNQYIKIKFTPLSKLEDKPIYNRIADLLNSYGISYNLNKIVKNIKDCTDNNPIVAASKINDIFYKHNDVMYFNKDNYLIVCKNQEMKYEDEDDISDNDN